MKHFRKVSAQKRNINTLVSSLDDRTRQNLVSSGKLNGNIYSISNVNILIERVTFLVCKTVAMSMFYYDDDAIIKHFRRTSSTSWRNQRIEARRSSRLCAVLLPRPRAGYKASGASIE